MSVLVTAERFLNSLHYKKSPVGNRHPGPECRALEERCGSSSTNQLSHLICCRAARSRPAPWLASRVQPCPCRRRRPNRVMEASKRGAVASRRSRRATLVAASSWAAFSSAAFCSAIAAVSAFFFGDGKNGKRGIAQQGRQVNAVALAAVG